MAAVFFYARVSSVLLRQRASEPLLALFLGCACLWVAVPLRDALGPAAFPCVLGGFCDFVSVPLLFGPLILRVVMHDNARVRGELRSTNITIRESQLVDEIDLSTFDAFVKTHLFRRSQMDEETKYKSLVFAASRSHVALWISAVCLPFLVGFFVALGTRFEWQSNCYGCALQLPEAVFLILASSLLAGAGAVNTWRIKKHPDPLGLVDECLTALATLWASMVVSLALYVADPGGVSGDMLAFNWRWIALAGTLATVYVVTVHQVRRSWSASTFILSKGAFDELDRLRDLRANKELFGLFKEHMRKEMSDEAIKFILDVDQWKSDFKRKKEGRQREARVIFDTYVVRKARLEVNIPSRVRDTLQRDFNKGNVALDVFDAAYKECVHLLMTDSVPRFTKTAAYEEYSSKNHVVLDTIRKAGSRPTSVRIDTSRFSSKPGATTPTTPTTPTTTRDMAVVPDASSSPPLSTIAVAADM